MTRPAATILIVDDEPANCKLLEALLHPEGYSTQTASDGPEALAAVAARAPDLILLDVMMPSMDGYEVTRRLKAEPATANIPVIMVSALIDRAARLAGLEAGAEEFLTKPVDRSELWLRVRNLLRLKTLGDELREHGATLEEQGADRTADLQRFRTAMDATADAIILLDRTSMRFTEVNASACTMVGYGEAELLGLGPADVTINSRAELEACFDVIIAGTPSQPARASRAAAKGRLDPPRRSASPGTARGNRVDHRRRGAQDHRTQGVRAPPAPPCALRFHHGPAQSRALLRNAREDDRARGRSRLGGRGARHRPGPLQERERHAGTRGRRRSLLGQFSRLARAMRTHPRHRGPACGQATSSR